RHAARRVDEDDDVDDRALGRRDLCRARHRAAAAAAARAAEAGARVAAAPAWAARGRAAGAAAVVGLEAGFLVARAAADRRGEERSESNAKNGHLEPPKRSIGAFYAPNARPKCPLRREGDSYRSVDVGAEPIALRFRRCVSRRSSPRAWCSST